MKEYVPSIDSNVHVLVYGIMTEICHLEGANQSRESVSFWLCYVQYEHNVIGVVSRNNQALVKS
jgi:hypothetical protein